MMLVFPEDLNEKCKMFSIIYRCFYYCFKKRLKIAFTADHGNRSPKKLHTQDVKARDKNLKLQKFEKHGIFIKHVTKALMTMVKSTTPSPSLNRVKKILIKLSSV